MSRTVYPLVAGLCFVALAIWTAQALADLPPVQPPVPAPSPRVIAGPERVVTVIAVATETPTPTPWPTVWSYYVWPTSTPTPYAMDGTGGRSDTQ